MKKNNLVRILKQELSILNEFIEGFSDVDNIHPIEVDLALSKVNDIKNELELLKSINQPTETITEAVKEKAEPKEVQFSLDNVKTEHITAEYSNTDAVTNLSEDIKLEKEEVSSSSQKEVENDHSQNILQKESVPVVEPINEETQDSNDTAEEFVEQPEELVPVENSITKEEPAIIEEIEEPEDEIITTEDTQQIQETELETDIEPITQYNEDSVTNKETILADKFSQEKPSLNDTLAGIKQNKDLASLLKDSPISDLNKAIKLNDRIWYINELFGKNSTSFEKAVQNVNNAENLDDALAYLFTNFNWNQERKSTISFLELVFRRFASN